MDGFAALVELFRGFRKLSRIALGGEPSGDWKGAAAFAALLLYDMTSRDAKNELLTCKLFAGLFGDSYRAHYGDSAYSYDHGACGKISALSYEALDFASRALRAAESLFLIMPSDGPPNRAFRSVAERVHFILDGKDRVDIIRYLHFGSGGASDWAVESTKIFLPMYKNVTDPGRDRVALANFTRWASEAPPVCDGGVNFANAYYEVRAPASAAAPMVCARKRKSPLNNSYASLPASIFSPTAQHMFGGCIGSSRRLWLVPTASGYCCRRMPLLQLA